MSAKHSSMNFRPEDVLRACQMTEKFISEFRRELVDSLIREFMPPATFLGFTYRRARTYEEAYRWVEDERAYRLGCAAWDQSERMRTVQNIARMIQANPGRPVRVSAKDFEAFRDFWMIPEPDHATESLNP